MFPRKYRLPLGKKPSFHKTFSTPHFLLKASLNKIGQNRLGIIISNAAVKKSTERHLWKRRFASQIRLWPNIGMDILVIISPKIESLSPKDLKKELDEMLKLVLNAF